MLILAAVDVSSLMTFLNSLLPALAGIDPVVAGLGALILFIVQKAGGGKFDLWGTVKWVLSKFAPVKGGPAVDPVVDPAAPVDSSSASPDLSDLAAHEIEVVKGLLDRIRAWRAGTEKSVADKAKELMEAVMK